MEIKVSTKDKWTIFKLSKRFDAKTSQDVYREVQKYLDDGVKSVAIDLSEVDYMSSAGLRVLLTIKKILKNSSGSMVLISPKDNVMEVLELSGFSNIFIVMNSIEGLL